MQLLFRFCPPFSRQEVYAIHKDEGNQVVDVEFPAKRAKGGICYRIIGIDNGVVCIADDGDEMTTYSIKLWNPMVKRIVKLPRLGTTYNVGGGVWPTMVGFVFDDAAPDFKVLRIIDYRDDVFDEEIEVYIWSVATRRWRNISRSALNFPLQLASREPQLIFNSSLHWLVPDFNNTSVSLVVFEQRGETFKVLDLPIGFPVGMRTGSYIHCFRLGVIETSFGIVECYPERYCAWAMKLYGAANSWTQVLNVQFPMTVDRWVGFANKGKVIVQIENNLFKFSPETLALTGFGVDHVHTNFIQSSLYVASYMETLGLIEFQDEESSDDSNSEDEGSLENEDNENE